MNWLDIKLLATIGASAAVGVAATSVILSNDAGIVTYDQTELPVYVIEMPAGSQVGHFQHADLLPWWNGEAPIRFSGPGARGMGKMDRSRRRSGFRLKDPPRRLGLKGSEIRYSIERPDLSRPEALLKYKLQIRPPEMK